MGRRAGQVMKFIRIIWYVVFWVAVLWFLICSASLNSSGVDCATVSGVLIWIGASLTIAVIAWLGYVAYLMNKHNN